MGTWAELYAEQPEPPPDRDQFTEWLRGQRWRTDRVGDLVRGRLDGVARSAAIDEAAAAYRDETKGST